MKSSLDFFCGFDKLCVSSSEHTYMVAQKTVTQVNVRPEFCDLLPEKGPCHGRWRRQFYNITSKSCQGKHELGMSSIQSERGTLTMQVAKKSCRFLATNCYVLLCCQRPFINTRTTVDFINTGWFPLQILFSTVFLFKLSPTVVVGAMRTTSTQWTNVRRFARRTVAKMNSFSGMPLIIFSKQTGNEFFKELYTFLVLKFILSNCNL